MDKTTLKAREIEALTFLFTSDPPARGGGDKPGSGRWLRRRPATVGLTAAFVVMAALAWVVLR